MKYLVIDFESTCWREGNYGREMETIEFPGVLADEFGPVAEFHSFVRPEINPTLTEFCTSLTSITQEQVDAAPTFPEVYSRFVDWMDCFGLDDVTTLPVAFGNFDLGKHLPEQCRRAGLTIDSRLQRWCNIKQLCRNYGLGPKKSGLKRVLKSLGLGFEGTPHRGIDDSRNIMRLVRYFLTHGFSVVATTKIEGENNVRKIT